MTAKTSYRIISNNLIAKDTFELVLAGDTSAFSMPGQFADLAIPGFYLRRPISVHDWKDGELVLLYKVVGRGTAVLSGMQPGSELEALTGLGHGFDADAPCRKPILVGGGLGAAPLYPLAKSFVSRGITPSVVLGFNTLSEIICKEKYEALGCKTVIATMDGSCGVKGFVTDAIREAGLEYDYFYTCGPKPMMKALSLSTEADGQISMEERMGCGYGACMGCTIVTASGARRVCKDGPVFKKEEIIW